MSKLPETHELPHAEEGYDPARVEEAFAAFADRVRELESLTGELRDELRALRTERLPAPRFDDEHWPTDPVEHASPDWVAAVPTPLARGVTVPRLAVEGVFLLLVALLAGLADLSAMWIVLVMAVAWALVALLEWAGAAKRARWRLDEIAPPVGAEAAETTGPWDMPVVESTVVDAGPDPESQTVIAKLPAEPEASEQTMDEPPRRRRLRLRRREPAETAAADPWDA